MIGYIGAFLLLLGYCLFSFNKISLFFYHVCNFFSCLFLAINAFQIGSIPFIITNIAFCSIAIYMILKLLFQYILIAKNYKELYHG